MEVLEKFWKPIDYELNQVSFIESHFILFNYY